MLPEIPSLAVCASFDDLLAPVLLTLDTFANYLDPATTPDDMIPWLAQWLGLVNLNVERAWRRHELQILGMLNAMRGTQTSIETELESTQDARQSERLRGNALVAGPGRTVAGRATKKC